MTAAVLAASIFGGGVANAQPWGPLAPPNPFLGPTGTSTMHGDAGSSDATPFPGPGAGPVSVGAAPLAAACPTLLEGSDGMIVALCTSVLGQVPTVHLIDPSALPREGVAFGGVSVAQFPLEKGSLLGGVYAYLDDADRLVAVDGNRQLVRVAHTLGTDGWSLHIDESTDLRGSIAESDAVTGLAPDWDGNVWFATGHGTVGTVDGTGSVRTVTLPAGEQVQNSISTSPNGTAVATTHALYELAAGVDGSPTVVWRAPYERGSARKPGQLSWGTGSTPTYFGPRAGTEYVAIVDSADEQVSLLVYRSGTGELVCSQPVLAEGGPGSENSPIGIGNTVIVAGTYGYPYPAVPEGAGPAVPESAPFTGGMTRVDLDATGCHTVWESGIRSSAVPHLSTADGLVYTVTRNETVGSSTTTTPVDGFAFAAVDPASGAVLNSTPMPGTVVNDPLQMSALITPRGEYIQGTITGVVAVAPR